MSSYRHVTLMFLAIGLSACASKGLEMQTVEKVDINKFMGDWYVIANIPTFLEKGAHNAVETYRLDEDGSIETTFTYRKGSFDGKRKTYSPRAFITNTQTNAIWGMRFVWPIKADYRIIYLDDDYSKTIIGRQSRDYVWIMAREPSISDHDYDALVDLIESVGYDVSELERVPQRW